MPPGTMGVRGLLRPLDWETTGVRRQPAGAQRGTAGRARAQQSRCVGLEVLPPAPVCPGRGPGVREVLSSYRPVVLPGGSGLTGAPPFGSGSSHPLPALGGPVKRCTGHEGPCPTDGPWPLLLWVWWAPLAPVCVLAPSSHGCGLPQQQGPLRMWGRGLWTPRAVRNQSVPEKSARLRTRPQQGHMGRDRW